MRRFIPAILLSIILGFAIPLGATDPDRDFSGKWVLDSSASSLRSLGLVEADLTVSQGDAGLLVSTGSSKWSYALDGSETRKSMAGESRNSVTKWEGSALIVNTLVAGAQDFTVMDRWTLSRDHNTLTIRREIVRAGATSEGALVYRREGASAPQLMHDAPPNALVASPAGGDMPTLAKRPEPGVPPDITVPTGTHVLLRLTAEVDSKHAKEGDHVYLRTDSPVAINGHVVLPVGCNVEGTITHAKPAGHVAGKGELYIRFDSLILPNGVQRDFKARPPRSEGAVDGNRKAADGRDVLMGAGMGAGVGAIASGVPGAAIGGGAGALAGVLLSRQQNVILPAGTHLEMVLDRDLVFTPGELMR
jgi:type IV secretion system protein VirB10